mgnify:CR=1 FL=1
MATYYTTKVTFVASRKSVMNAACESTFFKGFKLDHFGDEVHVMSDSFPWPNKTDFDSVKADIETELKAKGWELADPKCLGEDAIVFIPFQFGMSPAEVVAQH